MSEIPRQGEEPRGVGILFSACGFKCDLCPAFSKNFTGHDYQLKIASGWKKYYDIEMVPETIICDGCHGEIAEGRQLPARDCQTRECVADRLLLHCGECGEYPCEHKESKMSSIETTRDKYRDAISEEEREKFFEPYDARKNFAEIRKSLRH